MLTHSGGRSLRCHSSEALRAEKSSQSLKAPLRCHNALNSSKVFSLASGQSRHLISWTVPRAKSASEATSTHTPTQISCPHPQLQLRTPAGNLDPARIRGSSLSHTGLRGLSASRPASLLGSWPQTCSRGPRHLQYCPPGPFLGPHLVSVDPHRAHTAMRLFCIAVAFPGGHGGR